MASNKGKPIVAGHSYTYNIGNKQKETLSHKCNREDKTLPQIVKEKIEDIHDNVEGISKN